MTNTSMNRIGVLAVLAVLTVLACVTTAACSSPTTRSAPHGGSTRAAADAHQVTLRLGTDDGPDMPGAQQIKHFAGEVARLSGGAVTIKPVWHADHGQPPWGQ